MFFDLKCLLLELLTIHLTLGQTTSQMCPSDESSSSGCPNGWVDYLTNCYQLNTFPSLKYQEAKDFCKKQGAKLLRIENKAQFQYFTSLIDQKSIIRSMQWYTAGMIDPFYQTTFKWDEYFNGEGKFAPELLTYFIDRPNPNELPSWNKDRKRVSIVYNQMIWSLNITVETEPNYFFCQGSKAIMNKITVLKRTADFGQSHVNNILRGPCITSQPSDQLYVPMISDSKIVRFTCGAYGNPIPKITWWFVKDTPNGQMRTLINPLDYPTGIVSQTDGLLTLIDPDNSFNQNIECQASNDVGTVISKQVQIKRGRLEMYNKNARQEKVMLANKGFLLDCEPPDHSPADSLVYTFFTTRTNELREIVDDVIQPQLRNNLFLSTNLGLIGFSIASEKDTALYKCIIGWKGLTGTSYKSPDIPLKVLSSNVIYPPPMVNDKFPNFRPSNPFLGDTVEFECFGYGEIKQNPLKYFWTWNGKQIPPKAQISDFDRRMKLVNVQFEDEGSYGCRIETYDGGKVSLPRSITLQINAKPTFVIKPANQYPDVDSNVTLYCEAIGKPQVTIMWYRNSVSLNESLTKNPDPRYNFTEGTISNAFLTIARVKKSDHAMFGCVISNSHGRESSYVEMKPVSFAPNFDKYPLLNTESIRGSKFIIRCQPEGAPAPKITWSFNDNVLSLQPAVFDEHSGTFKCPNNNEQCILPNNNLLIDNVKEKGTYTCTATNKFGSISSSAYMDVIEPLVVNNFPVGRRVQVNTNVYLPCQASGTPYLDIDYDWYFENVRIKFDRMDLDARRYDKSQFFRPYYRYFGTLTISNIQFYDEGNYTCKITTPFNTISYSALILIVGPPGVIGGITINKMDNGTNSVVGDHGVQWTDGNTHGKPILWYKLEVAKEDGERKWYTLSERINKSEVTEIQISKNLRRNQFAFTGLPANTNFRLRMSAANEYGLGEPSSPSDVFKTVAKRPQRAPKNVTGGGGKVGTLVIRWEPLNPLEENGDGFYYQINYKETKEREFVTLSNMLNKSLDNDKYRQVTIDLPANKDYLEFDVQVRAVNVEGPGNWSEVSTIRSASKLPSFAPQDVRAGSFNSTAISVNWKPPAIGPGEGPIEGYHIVYWMRDSGCKSQGAHFDRVNSSQRLTVFGEHLRSGIIIGLTADRYYCIGVQMFNSAGDSLESSFVDQTTFKKPPQNFPTVMRLNSTNTPHQIQVSWNGVRVMAEEESVDGYVMRYWLSGAPVRTAQDVDVGMKTTGRINGLQYDVRYNLRIFAYSRGGNGKLSNPMDQFMLVPRDRCENNKVLEGPDVRYIFVCHSCCYGTSLAVLIVGLVISRLCWWL